jgi:hypothetical protein
MAMTATIFCQFLVFINSPVNQSNTKISHKLLQPSTSAGPRFYGNPGLRRRIFHNSSAFVHRAFSLIPLLS